MCRQNTCNLHQQPWSRSIPCWDGLRSCNSSPPPSDRIGQAWCSPSMHQPCSLRLIFAGCTDAAEEGFSPFFISSSANASRILKKEVHSRSSRPAFCLPRIHDTVRTHKRPNTWIFTCSGSGRPVVSHAMHLEGLPRLPAIAAFASLQHRGLPRKSFWQLHPLPSVTTFGRPCMLCENTVQDSHPIGNRSGR